MAFPPIVSALYRTYFFLRMSLDPSSSALPCAASSPTTRRRSGQAAVSRCFPWNRPSLSVFSLEVCESAPRNHIVAAQDFVCLDVGRRPEPFIDWAKILIAIVQKLLEGLDHEIGLLEIIDQISSAHDAF